MNGTHRTKRRTAALLLGFFAAAMFAALPARAASEPVHELVAVGQPIGVKLFSDGVLVIARTLFLADGRIEEDKPSRELFEHPQSPRLVSFLNKVL